MMTQPVFATETNYPHLRQFVRNHIVPNELSMMESVVTVYTQCILDQLKDEMQFETEPINLNHLIYMCSPFADYIDPGMSGHLEAGSEMLSSCKLDHELKIVLNKEGFEFNCKLGGGF